MNELKIFNSPDFGQVRTVTIDGKPWFVAKDVAMARLCETGKCCKVQKWIDEAEQQAGATLTAGWAK